jgi:CRP/FNR family transcriptional regulator, dissimilatory nitrate respiration regulator
MFALPQRLPAIHHPLFQVNQLPPPLQAVVTYRVLQTGEYLFEQGEFSPFIFGLESGQIRLQNFTATGQQISYYTVFPGEYFAEPALFYDTYLWTAIAEESSRIAIFPREDFLMTLAEHPSLALSLIAQLCCRLQITTTLLELRGMNSARERVLKYLQLLVTTPDQIIYLNRPFKDIAGDLSLTPEALSRTLRQFQEERIILRDRNKIKLL